MYVCVCNAITERDIRAAVAEGVREFGQLQERLRVSTCCGTCRDDARACLDACRTRESSSAGTLQSALSFA